MSEQASGSATAITDEQVRHLQTWIGKTQTQHDHIGAREVSQLAATLDRAAALPPAGAPLPPLWHWIYLFPVVQQSHLGADGHAARGEFLPPVPLPRRMWAGSRLHWDIGNPLRVGDDIQTVSRVAAVDHKRGRSGDLVFVKVHHEYSNASGLAITEAQDIVYRAAAQPGAPTPQPQAADQDSAWQREIKPDPVLLFRYSAVTFNGHRIHYDHDYVRREEGYPGLIVHGPLLATLLLDLLRRNRPDAEVVDFSFKAVRPIFDLNAFTLRGRPSDDGGDVTLWAQDHDGWLAMAAKATVQSK